jgi:hypothetical protein
MDRFSSHNRPSAVDAARKATSAAEGATGPSRRARPAKPARPPSANQPAPDHGSAPHGVADEARVHEPAGETAVALARLPFRDPAHAAAAAAWARAMHSFVSAVAAPVAPAAPSLDHSLGAGRPRLRAPNPSDLTAVLAGLRFLYGYAPVGAADAGEQSGLTESAAYWLAVAWGQRRLFNPGGTESAHSATPLPRHLASPACRELCRQVRQWTRQAEMLPAHLAACDNRTGHALCSNLLRARTEAWAAFLAIDTPCTEALRAGDADAEGAETFQEEVGQVFEDMTAFDSALQAVESSLASMLPTELLTEWRKALANPYREAPPWWLDGSLELLAERQAAAAS